MTTTQQTTKEQNCAAQAVPLCAFTAFAERFAPAALAIERDNVGLLVNSGAPVTRVLCALDITRAVVAEAVKQRCELIVSHHPVIYRPLKAVESEDVVYLLARHGISALCLHTNLDAAAGGVNDTLISLLGAEHGMPFGCGMGRVGTLAQPVTAQAFLQRCAKALGRGIRYTAVAPDAPVRTIAVLGGTGGDEAAAAFAAGADAYVTGEAGHHIGVAAVHESKLLVTAGHFATEHPVVAVLADKLAAEFPSVAVLQSEADTDPFCVL